MTHAARLGRPLLLVMALAAFAPAALANGSAAAAGDTHVVYGADLSQTERQELAQVFGVAPDAQAGTVDTAEMVNALKDTGLPVAPSDKSISSAAVTCLNKGDGLTVQTQNISRIAAPIYANALVTAGAGDANVLIAAPASNPVTGETALVGALKAFPACQAGQALDANRVHLAYQQIGWTLAMAGSSGDLTRASNTMLKAQQAVLGNKTADETTVTQALEQAAVSEGLQFDPSLRPGLVQFLQATAGLDYGSYAQGFQLQQSSPNQVRVVPAGAGAPTTAPAAATAPTASATTSSQPATSNAAAATSAPAPTAPVPPGAAAPAGDTFKGTAKGTVEQPGQPLVVRINGHDVRFGPATGAVVLRDGKSARLSDLHKGDRVTVTTDVNGSAQRVDAASVHHGVSPWAWLIPLLLVLAALAVVLWLLTRHRRGDFVLEPNAGGRPRRHGFHI